MRQRKQLMEQRGDAFIAFPGGIGTFEEFFEVLVNRSLGVHTKPIIVLNIGGYYDPLLQMMQHGASLHFIRPGTDNLFFVVADVDTAIAYLRNWQAPPAAKRPTSGIPSAAE